MYLFDSNLNDKKSIIFSIRSIFGIGTSTSKKIIRKLGFCKNYNFNMLSKGQLYNFLTVVNGMKLVLNNNLKQLKIINFKKLLELKFLKAFRKLKKLPIRGQRTKTNCRTAKKQNFFSFN